MATKIDRMKSAMYACSVTDEIVAAAVKCAEEAAAKPKVKKTRLETALAKFSPADAEIVAAFEQRFWPAYPVRSGPDGKAEARIKFVALVKTGKAMEKIIAAAIQLNQDWQLRLSRKPDDARFIPMAVTWLNKQRFEDGPEYQPPTGGETMMDLLRQSQGR